MSYKATDLTGRRFTKLTVIDRAGYGPRGEALWLCRCDCGNERVVIHSNLTRGQTKACGCLRGYRGRDTRHGDARHGRRAAEWICWLGIKRRCYDPAASGYEYYGGRGISVCDRWRFGENGVPAYECFLADMGRKPSPRHSIDRINSDGNYEPSNCRWATSSQQSRNKRLRHKAATAS